MKTISFYSYKGGVGRSLTLTNLGVYLARFGATVVMVDFDLEAPGLAYKLRREGPVAVHGRGLAGLLADISQGLPVDKADYDLAIDVSQYAVSAESDVGNGINSEQPPGKLFLVPAGNPLEPEYWRDLAAIDWELLFASEARSGVAALSLLKQSLARNFAPEVLLVDSRTGITPGGGIATTLLPDVVVTLLLNSPEHLDGSRTVVSAVTLGGAKAPNVIPVLSRYTSEPRRPVAATRARLARFDVPESDDDSALDELLATLREGLIQGLPEDAAMKVAQPLVLHSDVALQRRESLAFGTDSEPVDRNPNALLEDYLRLFAALVPREMVLRYASAVRARARAVILDRPDDAIGTLESLLTLVGDPEVFADLIKIYALRRDPSGMLGAADRLFRVHGLVLVQPALTEAIRGTAVRPQRGSVARGAQLPPRFLEAYWRLAAPEDVEWGANIALQFAQADATAEARRLADEVIALDPSPRALAQLVSIIARGNRDAERLALDLVSDGFDGGIESLEFLRAAARAVTYQEHSTLADRILSAPKSSALPDATIIELTRIAGRTEEASELLVEVLASMMPGDEALDDLATSWGHLASRNRALRANLATRNADIAEYMDNLRT